MAAVVVAVALFSCFFFLLSSLSLQGPPQRVVSLAGLLLLQEILRCKCFVWSGWMVLCWVLFCCVCVVVAGGWFLCGGVVFFVGVGVGGFCTGVC